MKIRINRIFLSITLVLVLCLGLFGCKKNPVVDNTPKELNTQYTDQLTLTTAYEGKNFLNDGIGKVTLTQTVDGDTAHFRDNLNRTFTSRFLGINTPESTGRIDPWGKAASKYTSEILLKATEIVLESEEVGKPAELDTTGKRYLAYVWYKTADNNQFRLLNLELVEMCYTQFTGNPLELKYGEIFNEAHLKSYDTKRRVYGEKDPSFDYSNEIIELTIAELKNNFDDYSGGSKLKITARVMRLSGSNVYWEDLNETFNESSNEYEKAAIYMFSGYGSGLSALKIGSVVEFNCQASSDEIHGRQLTNPTKVKVIENPAGSEVEIQTVPSDVRSLENYEGFVVKLENITVKNKIAPNETGAYTIYCQMENGAEVNLRIDGSAYPKFPYSEVEIGARYDVIGGVSKFNDTYQIMIGNRLSYAENDLLKK